jgi:hypothetical protein
VEEEPWEREEEEPATPPKHSDREFGFPDYCLCRCSSRRHFHAHADLTCQAMFLALTMATLRRPRPCIVTCRPTWTTMTSAFSVTATSTLARGTGSDVMDPMRASRPGVQG